MSVPNVPQFQLKAFTCKRGLQHLKHVHGGGVIVATPSQNRRGKKETLDFGSVFEIIGIQGFVDQGKGACILKPKQGGNKTCEDVVDGYRGPCGGEDRRAYT